MKPFLKKIHLFFIKIIPTFFYCNISGLKFDKTWDIVGKPIVIKNSLLGKIFKKEKGSIAIGKNFRCNNKIKSNSIGVIQPCVFNISTPNSSILIGNNVGISGSTINATTRIRIGNNVLIGSGCLISDTDSHPIEPAARFDNCDDKKATKKSPINIEDNVFIGARSIILKGVTIGKNSVIGAGSVVARDIPANSVAVGNPAKVVKVFEL